MRNLNRRNPATEVHLRRGMARLHDAISAAHAGQTIHDVPGEIVDWGSSGASTPAGAPADAQAASPGVGAGGGVASSGARDYLVGRDTLVGDVAARLRGSAPAAA